MKKGSILAGLILWAVLLAAGCGSKPVNGEESGESPGYAHMEGLDSVLAASMPLGDESSGTEEGQETENSMESLVREAEGDEATEELEILEDTDIYSKPGEEGAVVGSVKQGTTVESIEVLEGGAWCKIVYKGRVAYVLAEALERPGESSAAVPTVKPTAGKTGTTKKPSSGQMHPSNPERNPGREPTREPQPEETRTPNQETPPAGQTQEPTTEPTQGPTAEPTQSPPPGPTQRPTTEPTQKPTTEPTQKPTAKPTQSPPPGPTQKPTTEPTQRPTTEPTQKPTTEPTQSPPPGPTQKPTTEPTQSPPPGPTQRPTTEPTQNPTQEPTTEPTQNPTQEPTAEPTQSPTQEPTAEPTQEPTAEPTESPTREPEEPSRESEEETPDPGTEAACKFEQEPVPESVQVRYPHLD